MRPSDIKEMVEIYVQANMPIGMYGAPGVGKTSIASQVASQLDYDWWVFYAGTAEPTDINGFPVLIDKQPEFVPYANLKKLIDANRPTLAFFDDIDKAPHAIQSTLMNLFDSRTIGGHKISDEVRFVSAGNDKSHKAGSFGIIEPIKTRFHTWVEITPNRDDFVRWGWEKQLNPILLGWCRHLPKPELLFDFKPTYDYTMTGSPRTLHHLSDVINLTLPKRLRQEAYTSTIGQDLASSYLSFEAICDKLPDYRLVFHDPDNAPIPDDPMVIYAMMTNLVPEVTTDTLNALIKWCDRIEQAPHYRKDISMAIIVDVWHAHKEFKKTKEFMRWTLDHKDIYCQETR